MTLDRRQLALTLAAAAFAGPALAARPAIAPLSADDQALVDRAAAYLQALTEAKGRFIQVDARGAVTRGEIYLKRPGKARFAYDAPSNLLVVADGSRVSIANPQLKTFDSYPLMATPLSIFLARQIRLDKGILISNVARGLHHHRPRREEAGRGPDHARLHRRPAGPGRLDGHRRSGPVDPGASERPGEDLGPRLVAVRAGGSARQERRPRENVTSSQQARIYGFPLDFSGSALQLYNA